jgi:uncharacterized protein YPO0396
MDTTDAFGPRRPGYRLHRLDVFNWGTFDSSDGTVHSFSPEGRTSLLVGQNGSGKSTLVDAILTLLVPSGIRNYNVAAGARKTERSERSYVRGAFGRGSDDEQATITRYLRSGSKQYAALLAVFTDEQLGRSFTVCQILHQTTDGGIDKTFAIIDAARRLADDLADIPDVSSVAAQLAQRGYRTTKKYIEYSRWFAERTGARGKAMEMFNQTVAVKDIHSLNDFIRNHMLERTGWRDQLQKLLAHFTELSTAHRELVRVRTARELLEPIERVGREYRSRVDQMRTAERMLDAAELYFEHQVLALRKPEIERASAQLRDAQTSKARLSDRRDQLSETARSLANEIDHAGGDRLKMIPLLVRNEQIAQQAKQRERERFQQAAQRCDVAGPANSADCFEEMLRQIDAAAVAARKRLADCTSIQQNLLATGAELRRQLATENEQMRGLAEGHTNLPSNLVTLRATICRHLKIDESELPFAAELISLRADQQHWRAAAETVLRSFGLSLLVPDRHYRSVRTFVEQNRLSDANGRGMKLVYLRVGRAAQAIEAGDRVDPHSLLRKLEYRSRHPLAAWVRGEVAKRFDYLCCETVQQFDRTTKFAITANRHLKIGRDRHEKDDRPHAGDPRNFILGWETGDKLRRVGQRIAVLESEKAENAAELRALESEMAAARDVVEAAEIALSIGDFSAIDVEVHADEIDALQQEQLYLEGTSEPVRDLRSRSRAVAEEMQTVETQRDQVVARISDLKHQIAAAEQAVEQAKRKIETAQTSGLLDQVRPMFTKLDDQFSALPLDGAQLATRERTFITDCTREIAKLREKVDPLQQQLLSLMGRYLREFKAERTDLDASTDSLSSFVNLLQQIREEDLPKHEHRFKQRLNDKVGQEIALFYASLRGEAKQIEKKIEALNASLGELEYQPGTTMRLEPRPVKDREILDFQRALRECLVESHDDGGTIDENRFLKIEQLVVRLSDSEKTRWRDKVVDVRRWFDFAAREVDQIDGRTVSYYEDSSGQSGGEKAKLAFTILVAAIAYQYNLDPQGESTGRFHFVCVDEMFSKVDDRYAEYAMRLFEQFGLQVLIVAPLDAKARVTEPFVDCFVHVVKNQHSHRSQIFSMTAREYETVVEGFVDTENAIPSRTRRKKSPR